MYICPIVGFSQLAIVKATGHACWASSVAVEIIYYTKHMQYTRPVPHTLPTYFPLSMPMQRMKEKSSLSFSNSERQTLLYMLRVKCSLRFLILS